MKILNGKDLCQYFNFSTTLLYKPRKASMPFHQLPGGRAFTCLWGRALAKASSLSLRI